VCLIVGVTYLIMKKRHLPLLRQLPVGMAATLAPAPTSALVVVSRSRLSLLAWQSALGFSTSACNNVTP
jgi:hypothetical protein